MKSNGDHESKLWKVLEKEGLADLSQYHRHGFFDEVPFYSRNTDVAFLRKLGRDKADAALLQFGLKFLKALTSFEIPEEPFFAALTVRHNPEDALIVPNLFVCAGDVQQRVADHLVLQPVKSAASKRIQKLLSGAKLVESIQTLEDTATVRGMTRAMIGYSVPPYPNVVPLHALMNRVTSRA